MNTTKEMTIEMDLLLKLFETEHLNVPERNSLPNGKVRESVSRKLILNHLETFGWFPGKKQKLTGDAGGEYLQLEYRPKNVAIFHQNYEYSYMKYKHNTTNYASVNELITAYLKEKEKEGLDGLEIDWES